jgi:hypothetical protein
MFAVRGGLPTENRGLRMADRNSRIAIFHPQSSILDGLTEFHGLINSAVMIAPKSMTVIRPQRVEK